MSKTALLVVNIPEKIYQISQQLQEYLIKTLYVCLSVKNPPRITESTKNKIINAYKDWGVNQPNVELNIVLNELKNYKTVLDKQIDVVFLDPAFTNKDISHLLRQSNQSTSLVILNKKLEDTSSEAEDTAIKVYNNVVLGGTFDRLHAGHKILLTEALLRCTKRLTVGVTDINMIQSKKLWELIEPCEVRIEKLKQFLKDVDSSVEHNVVPIQDPFGPTQNDPDLDLIVVSEETYKGGVKVNEVRLAKNLKPLDIYTIDMASDTVQVAEEENKISSSNIRMRLLGTRIKPLKENPNIPTFPHIIGLSGGIASGKSSIGKQLATLGAGHIDCDKIAHKLYERGTDIYSQLIDLFGERVVASDGTIDRRVLGGIVFSDKRELDKLNKLLWPAILQDSLRESQRLYKEENKRIVVMEAAVLLQAGWYNYTHEVWTCIIPRDEAIKRLMHRNKLSEKDAKSRVDAQPSNEEQVRIANTVFSTLWSYEFTHQQIEKAWSVVTHELSKL